MGARQGNAKQYSLGALGMAAVASRSRNHSFAAFLGLCQPLLMIYPPCWLFCTSISNTEVMKAKMLGLVDRNPTIPLTWVDIGGQFWPS